MDGPSSSTTSDDSNGHDSSSVIPDSPQVDSKLHATEGPESNGNGHSNGNGNGHGSGEERDPSNDFPDEACLFIGDIARGLTEDQLKEPFLPFGVASVEIKRDRSTGYSLGYGFAYFRTKSQAAAAKKALYKAVIGQRAIRLGWAQKNTNLFVGDLDPSVTTDVLREAFAKYGPIYKEETFVKHRNYGFVRFKHRKHAEAAKREMDGKVLGSRPIRIGWGEANYQRHCVHIQFDPAESDALTESDVIAKFEEFGTVHSVNLPRTTQGALRGFGFIYYDDTDEGEDAASGVIAALNGVKVSGVTLQCNFGKKPNSKKKKTVVPLGNSPRRQNGNQLGMNGGRQGGIASGMHGGNGGHHQAVAASSPGSSQSQLYPVQVMMPVGPGGTWQPVQYMMTAHQAQQFYSSVQYNPHPQHAPTTISATESPQVMVPMYYTYRVPGKDKDEESEEAAFAEMHQQAMLQQQQQQQHHQQGLGGVYQSPRGNGGYQAISPQPSHQQQQHQPMSYAYATTHGNYGTTQRQQHHQQQQQQYHTNTTTNPKQQRHHSQHQHHHSQQQHHQQQQYQQQQPQQQQQRGRGHFTYMNKPEDHMGVASQDHLLHQGDFEH